MNSVMMNMILFGRGINDQNRRMMRMIYLGEKKYIRKSIEIKIFNKTKNKNAKSKLRFFRKKINQIIAN